MEEYLGKMASRPSRVSHLILYSNGIQKRYAEFPSRLFKNTQFEA
jgi:hypothetical protein